MSSSRIWASGPAELLQHGLDLLMNEGDRNRRLAMISIDNAVELMIRTYLDLPKRVTGIAIGRQRFAEISETFPRMLDALEEHAPAVLEGIDLGEVEWFHRLRNQLYHQGNGLTVEREKVEVYATLAGLLFQNLFGERSSPESESSADAPRGNPLSKFLKKWYELDIAIAQLVQAEHQALGRKADRHGAVFGLLPTLVKKKLVLPEVANQLYELRALRNKIVHGSVDYEEVLSREVLDQMDELYRQISSKGRAA